MTTDDLAEHLEAARAESSEDERRPAPARSPGPGLPDQEHAGQLVRRARAGPARPGDTGRVASVLARWPPPPLPQTLKRTPLFDRHVDAGAKLVPFAGWEMPVQYGGIREEHVAVRDALRRLRRLAHGRDRDQRARRPQELLQRLLSNDVEKLAVGGAQYAVLCREDGGVLDDLFTYRLGARPLPDRHQRRQPRQGPRVVPGRTPAASTPRSTTRTSATRCSPSRARGRARSSRRWPTRRCPRASRPRERTLVGRAALVCGTGYTGEDGVELLLRPRRRAGAVGRARCAAAPRPPAWPRATRCASRSASTSTATT